MAPRPKTLRDALLKASKPGEILPALARVEYRRLHPDEDCPAEAIPADESVLAGSLPDCSKAERAEADAALVVTLSGLVSMLSVGEPAPQGKFPEDGKEAIRLPSLTPAPGIAGAQWQALEVAGWVPDMQAFNDAGEPVELPPPPGVGTLRLMAALAPGDYAALLGLSGVHRMWAIRRELQIERDALPALPHPLAALMRAWQARPREVKTTEIDRRESGIVPAFASARIRLFDLVRPDPADLPALGTLGIRQPDPSGQLWLPGLNIDAGDGAAAFILAILDAGSDTQKGGGAPLRDRFFAELLMAAGTQTRDDGERHYLHGLRIADAIAWAGWERRSYRPDREDSGLALSRGLRAMNAINMPLNDKGGWLIPAFVEAIKSRAPDDPIIASVRLPEGSSVHGARVDRATLRAAGKASAVAWRLYLSLCFEWNRIAYKGQIPHLTRPARKRDKAGYLLGADGNLLTDKRGRPKRSGRDARAVETGEREASPQGERLHRVYDGPGDLVRLVWPLGAPGEKTNRSRAERQVVTAARWLAGELGEDGRPLTLSRSRLDAPAIRIERLGKMSNSNPNPDGFPWRIVPAWVK